MFKLSGTPLGNRSTEVLVVIGLIQDRLLCPYPPSRVEALSADGRRLSRCPSVCTVPDPKSRTEGHSKLKLAGMKSITWMTRDPI